jgi:hypothetical protein
MEIAFLILLLSLVPAIASWWQMRQFERRMQRRIESIANQSLTNQSGTSHGLRRAFDLANAPPEFRYIDGVGYVIGDLSCQFNARSPHMRCAINPFGPCKNCTAYEAKV